MKPFAWVVLAGIGLVASTGSANAQYFYGYNFGSRVYAPPGFGMGYPGYYNGFIPGVNQTVISVTPYWRPLVINTPVVTTPFGPNYYYSNYYGFRTTPFGFDWAARRYWWVDGGSFYPPAITYPGYGYPAYGYPAPAVAPAPVPVTYATRTRITRGFVPVVSPLAGAAVVPASFETVTTGSFTPWGAYLPGSGTYVNPFSGVVVR
jgi:hypothetical protein